MPRKKPEPEVEIEDLDEVPEDGGDEDEEPEEKPKRPKRKAGDAKREAEDMVALIDYAQTAVSEKLAFSEEERAFHGRTVELLVNHYGVRPTEYLILAHAGVSCFRILGRWTQEFFRWIGSGKKKGTGEASGSSSAVSADGEKVTTSPPDSQSAAA